MGSGRLKQKYIKQQLEWEIYLIMFANLQSLGEFPIPTLAGYAPKQSYFRINSQENDKTSKMGSTGLGCLLHKCYDLLQPTKQHKCITDQLYQKQGSLHIAAS